MKVIVSLKGGLKELAKVPEQSHKAFLDWMQNPHGGCIRFSRQGTPIIFGGDRGSYDWFFRNQLKVKLK